MVNAIDGEVRLNVSGAGSITVARARNETLSESEEIFRDCIVMRSENGGKGVLRPGAGKPGIGGTGVS